VEEAPDAGDRGGAVTARETRRPLLAWIGPGLLVAATGVGAGDLATAAFTGNALGTAVLWAVVVGAAVKLLLNEGLARWQLATGETLLEGALSRLPYAVRLAFLGYFLVWSFLVAAALMSACGVTAHAILPLFGSAAADKIAYGLLHGALGALLVRLGGYKLFERVMGGAIVLMFVTVVVTAVRVAPDAARIWRGLLVPAIPEVPGAAGWTAALLGGVGGTLTVLCYGYWIREEGRDGISDLPACRLDLGLGYAMTALFGIAMVIVGSTVEVTGSGAGLVGALADRREASLGAGARWTFVGGGGAAGASRRVGVWGGVP
jgi:Mn2+/Fe2+ NRAMP family transporter